MPGSVSHRRHHSHRVRHGGDPVRRLQRLPRVYRRLPLRRDRLQPGVGHGAEVHPVLRPAQGRPRAGVFQSLPDRLDPVRGDRRATHARTQARRPAQGAGRQGRALRRRPAGRARRAQFVLPAGRRARSVRSAAAPAAPLAASRQELDLLGGERRRLGRAGPRRPPEAAHGRNGRRGWEWRRRRGGRTELMSDTFFSGAPHWTWFIIPYFFIGGLAGGAYFLAALLDWFGRPEDRPVVRTGYDVAAVGAILSGLLLTVDLGQPLRFWHMLFQSANFPAIMFKGWSPISFGVWGFFLFGL